MNSDDDVARSPSTGLGHVSEPVPEPGLLLDKGGGHIAGVFLSITGMGLSAVVALLDDFVPDILDAVEGVTDSVLDKDDDDNLSFFLNSLNSLVSFCF